MRNLRLFFCCAALIGACQFATAQPNVVSNNNDQECDSIAFNITLSDANYDGVVIPQLLYGTDIIATDTFPYMQSLYEQNMLIKIAIPSGLLGEHACVVKCENTGSQTGTSDVEEIDLVPCPPAGIDENKIAWCNAWIADGGVKITINNSQNTIVSIFDLHGKTVLERTIAESQLISLDLQAGIYFLIIQQGNKTKTFKLRVTD